MHIGLKIIGYPVFPDFRPPRRWVFAALAAIAIIVPASVAWAQSATLTKNYQRGSTLFEAGMYEAAMPYFLHALALSEKEYGPKSSRTGFILKNLATVYSKQRKFALAEPIYLRALAIFEESFGRDNGLVAELVSDLSFAYVDQKKFAQAEPLLARVLGYLEAEFGPDDSRVAVAAYNYGYAREFLGDAPTAREFYARAMRLWQSQRGPNDSHIKALKGRLDGLDRLRVAKSPSLAPFEPRLLASRAQAAPIGDSTIASDLTTASGNPEVLEVTPPQSPLAPTEKAWHVQLSSYRAPEAAERESKRLRRSFGSLFVPAGGLRVVRAQLPIGDFYRVGVGPMADHAAAITLCKTLKERDQSCFVVRR